MRLIFMGTPAFAVPSLAALVEDGYEVAAVVTQPDAPNAPKDAERVGDAHLFAVTLEPHAVKHVEIAEATPIERTLDLSADVTLQMMKVYVDAPDGAGKELRDQLKKLLLALGADRKKLAPKDPGMMRDLQRVCITCGCKPQCERELAMGSAAQHYRNYCPNASSLAALFASK